MSHNTATNLLRILPTIAAAGVLMTGCSATQSSNGASDSFDAAACSREVGDFVDVLSEIDSRLNIGVNLGELGTHLGDAQVEYDAMDASAAVAACGNVAAKAENAFTHYVKSYNAWQTCIDSDYCEPATPRMQTLWQKASRTLGEINSKLDAA